MLKPTPERIEEVKRLRYLFIRVPRTASTSMDNILKGYNRHIYARAYKRFFTAREWNSLFKFAFVRNPYTRFVSAYYAFAKDKREVNEYLNEEGLDWLIRIRKENFQPQYKFVSQGGKILVDFLGRFERLKTDWKKVAKLINVDTKLPHLAASSKTPLTKKNKRLIYELYKKDFELLGYDK